MNPGLASAVDDRTGHHAASGDGSPWVRLFSGDLAADLATSPPDNRPDLVTLGVVLTRLREL